MSTEPSLNESETRLRARVTELEARLTDTECIVKRMEHAFHNMSDIVGGVRRPINQKQYFGKAKT